MQSRPNDHRVMPIGMIFLCSLILFLSTGCQKDPLSSDARLSLAQDGSAQFGANQADPIGFGSDEAVDRSLFCVIFPIFCRDWCRPFPCRPLDPCLAWGGPDFDLRRSQVPAFAQWHNACMTAWRTAPLNPREMVDAMEREAEGLGLTGLLDKRSRVQAEILFSELIDGSFDSDLLPKHEDVLADWHERPRPGPFADDLVLEQLLMDLGNGISPREVADWQNYAASKEDAELREYWAATCMAATVAWWHDFALETGENCAWGVYADLTALQRTYNWRIIAIASAAGALKDMFDFFRPSD
ncbi:MAG: hypothetical protein Q8O14_01035 [bacterium]|nr:hypothetical protein [bacterium]